MSKGGRVVKDGPISDEYNKTKIKVLHLLKEPTDDKYGSIPVRVEKDGICIFKSRSTLFKISALRSYCVQNNFQKLDTIKNVQKQSLLDALRKSALMNISKICRYAIRTTDKELSVFIKENFSKRIDELRKEEYRPDVIICGGINMLPKITKFLGIKEENIATTKGGRPYFYFKDENWQTIFFSCLHPSDTSAKSSKGFRIFCQSWKEIYDKYSFLHKT